MKNLLPVLFMLTAYVCINAQQTAVKPPVIENLNTNCTSDSADTYTSCGTYLVNKNTFDRVVVTLTRVVGQAALPLRAYDLKFRSAQINTHTRQLLLQAGERVKLRMGVMVKVGQIGSDNIRVPFTYKIDGFYVPKPDVRQLPEGDPQDYLRFVENHFTAYDNTPLCWDGTGPYPKAVLLNVVNLHFTKTISISHRTRRPRPTSRNDWKTSQVHPSNESIDIGCVSEMNKYLDVEDAHFVN